MAALEPMMPGRASFGEGATAVAGARLMKWESFN
jgi:hypothetical protein